MEINKSLKTTSKLKMISSSHLHILSLIKSRSRRLMKAKFEKARHQTFINDFLLKNKNRFLLDTKDNTEIEKILDNKTNFPSENE